MIEKISVDQLASHVVQKLQEYSDEVAEQIRSEVDQVCKETVLDLKKTSPKRTGVYARSWSKHVVASKKGRYVLQIYNKKKPSLTHLLEYGHKNPGGSMVAARQHIRPAEEKAKQKLTSKVKVALE